MPDAPVLRQADPAPSVCAEEGHSAPDGLRMGRQRQGVSVAKGGTQGPSAATTWSSPGPQWWRVEVCRAAGEPGHTCLDLDGGACADSQKPCATELRRACAEELGRYGGAA